MKPIAIFVMTVLLVFPVQATDYVSDELDFQAESVDLRYNPEPLSATELHRFYACQQRDGAKAAATAWFISAMVGALSWVGT